MQFMLNISHSFKILNCVFAYHRGVEVLREPVERVRAGGDREVPGDLVLGTGRLQDPRRGGAFTERRL